MSKLSDKECTNGEVLGGIVLFTFLAFVVGMVSDAGGRKRGIEEGQRIGMERGYKLAMENKVRVTYTTNIVEKIEFKE